MVIILMRIIKVSFYARGNWDEKVFIAAFCNNAIQAHFIGFSYIDTFSEDEGYLFYALTYITLKGT